MKYAYNLKQALYLHKSGRALRTLYAIYLMLVCGYVWADSEDGPSEAQIYQDIVQQSHDYSCGAAALATLIAGITNDKNTSESDVIAAIEAVAKTEPGEGYSLHALEMASGKLGHYAQAVKIPKESLPKIKKPVMLLIGRAGQMPHYVVLKGIRNNVAFLADPIRGNLRVDYENLAKDGLINAQDKWYILVMEPSRDRVSKLFLPQEQDAVNLAEYLTEDQANIITQATFTKKGQIIASYEFGYSNGNRISDSRSLWNNFSHSLNLRYGITDTFESGVTLSYFDEHYSHSFDRKKIRSSNNSMRYSLFFNNKQSIDKNSIYNLIYGLEGGYYNSVDVFYGALNISVYTNTKMGQIILDGSIGKSFSDHDTIDATLPEYNYSVSFQFNKPVFDKFLWSADFTYSYEKNKRDYNYYGSEFTPSTSLAYAFNKNFQTSISFGYYFGVYESYNVGLGVAYIGGW